MKVFLLSPFLLLAILLEHARLKRIIHATRPELVISDNRYGLWSSKVKSILITHQCRIPFPGYLRVLRYPASRILRLFIERFDLCWVPDYPGKDNLAGDLAHGFPLPSNAVFIGPVSRFSEAGIGNVDNHRSGLLSASAPPDGKLLILLSGPEPQRTVLEKIILEQVHSLTCSVVILQGLPGKQLIKAIGPKHTLVSHLPSAMMRQLLANASYVICRSGYTSLMDLVAMNKKAMIIPTPGQTEQEYLAGYLSLKGVFLTGSQENLDLTDTVTMLEEFRPVFPFPVEDLLREHLESL
jgi:hypothetical protein